MFVVFCSVTKLFSQLLDVLMFIFAVPCVRNKELLLLSIIRWTYYQEMVFAPVMDSFIILKQ